MKFISFIASTMLIALISQQSTMGLPLNNIVEENIESTSIPFDISTIRYENVVLKEDAPRRDGACPDGMEHGEHGICQDITTASTPFDKTTILNKKVVLKKDSPRRDGACLDGWEHGEHGICQKIKSDSTPFDMTTILDEKVVPKKNSPRRFGACPDGMEHGEHGICQKIKSHNMIKATTELTDDTVKPKEDIVESKEDIVKPKEDSVKPKDDTVKPKDDSVESKEDSVKPKDDIVKSKEDIDESKEDIVKPKDDSVKPKDDTVKPKDDSVESKEDIVKPKEDIVESKEDSVKPKDDIVKPKEDIDESKEDIVEPKDDIVKPKHGNVKVTDDSLEKKDDVVTKPSKFEIPRGCPEGTKPDERGYCLEIKPSKLTKNIVNPTMFLNKDGSCPINYKMIGERCLYIKREKISGFPPFSTAQDSSSNDVRTKKYTDDSIKYEYVIVLVDNSCPEGTEYSEYGLCRRRIYPTMSNKFVKVDGHCAVDYELINGECVLKKKVEMPYLSNGTKMVEPYTVTLKNVSYHKEEPKKFTQ